VGFLWRGLALATLGLLAQPAVSWSQVDALWLGEWRLNLAKSTYNPGPAPYLRAAYRIQPHADGVRVVYDMVRPRGGVIHLEWTGRFDGQDYPMQGVEEAITYAYRRVGGRTYEIVMKVDDQPTATSRATVSATGDVITTSTAGRDARGARVTTVTVYEKRKE
jgi:hypothetical protein